MPLTPGTYKIHDTDSSRALTYYASNKIGGGDDCEADFVKWHVKCYPGSSRYAIEVTNYNKYFTADMNGDDSYGVEENNATVLEFEHQFQDFYLIKLAGTTHYLWRTSNWNAVGGENAVKFKNTVALQGCFWRFARINDNIGSILSPRHDTSNTIPPKSQPNYILSQGSGIPYADDAHFLTDMLFNMPRTPFTRTQRMATLEWARKMGAVNVPTMDSFDECERQVEAASRSGTNKNE